jgi:hypothetical protein
VYLIERGLGNHSLRVESLLSLIDESVRSRPGPAGFQAHLCLVERCADGDRYWHLAATRREVSFGYRDDVPEGCTALLVFDEAEGRALLQGEGRGESFRLAGDRKHLSALLERYLGGASWLAIRAGGKK